MPDLAHVHSALLLAHEETLGDPRNSPEGLDRAACPPHRKHLAILAAGASAEGLSADDWRGWVLDGVGPEAQPLLDSAEECMRASGLWPWPS